MLIEVSREELIKICLNLSVGKSYSDAEEATNNGWARFTGNQHNESWSWNKEYLNALSDAGLIKFYNQYK